MKDKFNRDELTATDIAVLTQALIKLNVAIHDDTFPNQRSDAFKLSLIEMLQQLAL